MRIFFVLLTIVLFSTSTMAQVQIYGDQDVLDGTVTYPGDPTVGATLVGLPPDVVTFGILLTRHFGFPTPGTGEFPGTDQIYVGTGETRTSSPDAYSRHFSAIQGPQVLVLDYSSLVPTGEAVDSLTLGLAVDDFQAPTWGPVYTASMNGAFSAALSAELNALNQTGPRVQFFTIGIDPGVLDPSHTLTVSIDQSTLGPSFADAWAIDYVTVGVTTIVLNEPPDCSAAAADPEEIWPPNHEFVPVAITGVTDPDGDPVTVTTDGVIQNEPVQEKGSGNTSPDAILDPLHVRAEREGGGNGRVYHIDFTADDGMGGTCQGTLTVCVPHDQSGDGCEGSLFDSTVP